ncbi:MAG TPA: hypothetical protein VF300_00665 [Methanothrix sp.]
MQQPRGRSHNSSRARGNFDGPVMLASAKAGIEMMYLNEIE